jgi:hypothetical protein
MLMVRFALLANLLAGASAIAADTQVTATGQMLAEQ